MKLEALYRYRYELFFFSQIAILFGGLLVPTGLFESLVSPTLFIINVSAGIILASKKKNLMWVLIALLVIIICSGILDVAFNMNHRAFDFMKMLSYFLFYTVVALELIRQVWNAKSIGKKVIYGLISGYITLGLLGFFITLSIEMIYPNSYRGFIDSISITENLIYYSFITLTTIGYGDIVPTTSLSRNAAVLIGLLGQFYLVILTAIVVGKYINQKEISKLK